ncbi:MAG: hypothetical protein NWF07_10315 [Candidatus Bathyarchaeota archaeon]|nr:hypothetical protein [Candidatus Bathyarchaeota archaeon]
MQSKTGKKKSKFSILYYKNEFVSLIEDVDQKTLAAWAIDCTERVMHYYEEKHPDDTRPRNALETLQKWIETGDFKMKIIRGASLGSHAAAREVGEDNAARSVARAAGQTVATAHVSAHAIGGAIYALQAIHRASDILEADTAVAKELDWQKHHLNELKKTPV